MLVIPTCTLERKRVGSDESATACLAPALPVSAICSRRARLDPTIAISDIAKMPLRRIRNRRSEISVSMNLSWTQPVHLTIAVEWGRSWGGPHRWGLRRRLAYGSVDSAVKDSECVRTPATLQGPRPLELVLDSAVRESRWDCLQGNGRRYRVPDDRGHGKLRDSCRGDFRWLTTQGLVRLRA